MSNTRAPAPAESFVCRVLKTWCPIRAALTGHQVFSTLHTNDSAGAGARVFDMGGEAFLVSSSLGGGLAQRLVRRTFAPLCVEWPVPAGMRDKLATLGARKVEGRFYHGRGCEECRGTGYRGRIGMFELLVINPELRDLILQRRSSAEIKTAATKTMLTMHQDAL